MGHSNDNPRAAALMVGAQVAYTVNDAFMKALSDEIPFFQAMFLRALAVVVVLALMAWALGQLRFEIAKNDRWPLFIRSVAEALTAFFFVAAVFNMPLANATAIIQVSPLLIALGAYFFFAEPLGWRRLTAIFVGFLGVLLIVRPGFEGFTIWSISALAAVVTFAIRDLVTRPIKSDIPSLTVAFFGAIGVLAFAAIGAFFADWAPVSPLAAVQLSGAVLALMVAYLLSVMVMRIGEIGFVAPFRYSGLVAALILGLVLFDEWPDGLTLIGTAIVVATGIYMLYREYRT